MFLRHLMTTNSGRRGVQSSLFSYSFLLSSTYPRSVAQSAAAQQYCSTTNSHARQLPTLFNNKSVYCRFVHSFGSGSHHDDARRRQYHNSNHHYTRFTNHRTNSGAIPNKLYLLSYLSFLVALSNYVLFHTKSSRKYVLYAEVDSAESPVKQSEQIVTAATAATTTTEVVPGLEVPGLPVYSLEDVAKHNDINSPDLGVWIIYKAGVYDVSQFARVHPGGDNILLGAGNSVEPFWEVYGQHKTQQVYDLLESFRIGNLREEDRLKPSDIAQTESFEYTPERNPGLIMHHTKPCNAESPPQYLQTFLTPNHEFFIRHHLSVPEVDPTEYELEVEGLTIGETRTFTLNQIKSLFPKHTVTSVIQCAGNRRDSFNEIKEVKGIPWGVGAIGNAQWTGAKLVDVLRYSGAQLDHSSIKHVQFEGLDLDATSTPYGASVPADKALNPMNEFVLAYEMNGEPIPADHGFPVRLIAPGVVGARNVKWLGKIVLSEEESHSHWQRNDYKSFPSSQESATNEQFASAFAIQELPVQSAICTPADGDSVTIRWKLSVDSETSTTTTSTARPVIEVNGYAWSGGGRDIIRVDLSIDGGQTWHVAALEQETPKKSSHHTYSWTLWKANLPLTTGQLYQGKQLQILCRAHDSSYNTQPKEPTEIWNFRGLLNNSWHRVNVRIH